MASFMMSVGRAFSIEPAGSADDYDAWEAHPALSLPGVRQVGQDLVETMAQWFESGREGRLDTLGAQVERAVRIGGSEALSEVAGTPAFAEWAEAASKLDPRDRAMADVWQAALLSLQHGGVGRLRMLQLARRMAPDEAAAFRALTAKKTQPDAEALARLQALGLVKTIRQRLFSRASLFLYMSLFSAVCFIGTAIAAMPDLFPRMALALSVTPALEAVRASVHLPPSLLIIALGSLLTSIPMMLHIVLDEAQLTSDGATLAALLRTVAEDKAVPAQAAEVLEADAQPNIYRFRDVALAG